MRKESTEEILNHFVYLAPYLSNFFDEDIIIGVTDKV